jgi:hypothetical protein
LFPVEAPRQIRTTSSRNKGEISLWVTADERRLPVKIQSKNVIGAVNLELVEAVLPRLGG